MIFSNWIPPKCWRNMCMAPTARRNPISRTTRSSNSTVKICRSTSTCGKKSIIYSWRVQIIIINTILFILNRFIMTSFVLCPLFPWNNNEKFESCCNRVIFYKSNVLTGFFTTNCSFYNSVCINVARRNFRHCCIHLISVRLYITMLNLLFSYL